MARDGRHRARRVARRLDPQARREVGFWVFLASNALWVAWGWHTGAWALVVLQVCLAALNIRGAVKAAPPAEPAGAFLRRACSRRQIAAAALRQWGISMARNDRGIDSATVSRGHA